MADLIDQTTDESAGGTRAGNRALSVMDRVREAILGGAVSAGERLNEVQLSKTLSVSRTPVRAALLALAGEGLLDYAPNRGFTVREFPLPAIVDAYDIRAALEGVAVRFAAERGLGDQEKEIIEAALRESGGQVFGPSGAAARLGMPRSTLESKIRSLKINKNRFKAADPS